MKISSVFIFSQEGIKYYGRHSAVSINKSIIWVGGWTMNKHLATQISPTIKGLDR